MSSNNNNNNPDDEDSSLSPSDTTMTTRRISSSSSSSVIHDPNGTNHTNKKLRRFATGSMELNIKDAPTYRDISHYVSTFVAGVGSGALASIICAPLDLMRTRMQVWGDVVIVQEATTTTTNTTAATTSSQNATANTSVAKTNRPSQAFQEILKKEGWKGMFRGLGATLVTVPLFWGVYFPLYDETKYKVGQAYPNMHQSLVHCGSAVMTGAFADVICNPLFVIRTRLQTQALHQLAEHKTLQATGMIQTARELLQTHGIFVFWRGMTANLMGLSHVAVQFPTYEFLKSHAKEMRRLNNLKNNNNNNNNNNTYSNYDPENNTPLELLVASGLAKMSASLLTYPHEVLRSRMMDSRSTIAPTLRGTIQHIWIQEGIKGFYTGLPVTLLRVLPNCCITFLTYELLLRWSKEQWKEHKRQKRRQEYQESRSRRRSQE